MKKLELNQMAVLEGGKFSWSGCANGALGAGLTPVLATAWNPWLAGGMLAAGCIIGGFNL